MNQKKQEKNQLTEKIKDLDKVTLARGLVLAEVINPYKATANLTLPGSAVTSGVGYLKVIKTGDDDLKEVLPDYKPADPHTKPGNIILSLNRNYEATANIVHHGGKEYVVFSGNAIAMQTAEDNFETKKVEIKKTKS